MSTPSRSLLALVPSLLVALAAPASAFAQGDAAAGAAGSTGSVVGATVAAAGVAGSPEAAGARLTRATGVTGGLTADEVARRAEGTSPDVAARRAEVAAAAAAVDVAVAGYTPRLTLSGRYARLSPIDAPLLGVSVVAPGAPVGPLPADARLVNVPLRFPVLENQTSFVASVSLPISDYLLRVARTQAAARRSEDAARHTEIATRRRARADARVVYYAWARAQLTEIVAAQSVAQATAHLRDVERLRDAGAANQADVMRVESQQAQAEQLQQRSRNLAAALASQLRTLTHDDAATPYSIGEDLQRDLLLPEPDEAALLDEALLHRPELRAADENVASLRQQAAAARAGLYPRAELFGDVTSANPNPRYIPAQATFQTTWSVGGQLSWSLDGALTARATGRQLDARQAQAQAQRRGVVDALRVELAQAVQATRDARSAQLTAARGLAAAEESYRARRSLFQNGRATVTELLDAETDLTRARLDAVAARIDARVAEVRLRHAAGRDGILGRLCTRLFSLVFPARCLGRPSCAGRFCAIRRWFYSLGARAWMRHSAWFLRARGSRLDAPLGWIYTSEGLAPPLAHRCGQGTVGASKPAPRRSPDNPCRPPGFNDIDGSSIENTSLATGFGVAPCPRLRRRTRGARPTVASGAWGRDVARSGLGAWRACGPTGSRACGEAGRSRASARVHALIRLVTSPAGPAPQAWARGKIG